MSDEEIADAIAEIMVRDGPDGHCDGHEVIAQFVFALRDGIGEEWFAKYLGHSV